MSNLPAQAHQPGTAVATTQSAQPGVGIDALGGQDIRLPRMKFGQYTSRVVTRKLVPFASIYVVTSQEDQEPIVLAQPGDKLDDLSEPVRFYVLGVRPGWSYTDHQKELARSMPGPNGVVPYPSLALVKDNDPKNVRRTYDYTLTVPAYPELPVMFIMHGRWGGQSSKQINTRLVLSRSQGIVPNEIAFKIQTRGVEAEQGTFASSVVGLDKVAAKDKRADLELVQNHLELVGGANISAVDDEPEAAPEAAVPASDAPPLD